MFRSKAVYLLALRIRVYIALPRMTLQTIHYVLNVRLSVEQFNIATELNRFVFI
jgi:hypothetical protein